MDITALEKNPSKVFIKLKTTKIESVREEEFHQEISFAKFMRKLFCPCMKTKKVRKRNMETQTSQGFVFDNQPKVPKPLL